MDRDDELDYEVDSIIDQIKNQSRSIKKAETEYPNLQKEDLERFVIDNASAVITDSVEMVHSIKDEVIAGGDARAIEAVSELVKAVTGAIDSLAKLKLSDDKIKGQKEIKQMEIDARNENNESNTPVLTFTRDEVLKKMLSIKSEKTEDVSHKVIDV